MSDLIERQAAIDAIDAACMKYDISPYFDDKRTDEEKRIDWWEMDKVLVKALICDLPSVQPVGKDINVSCKDAISRADAIDAIEKAKTAKVPDGEMYVAKINAEMNIQLLPSVQPEIIRCKDCKHWKDSDGVYRRGIGAESKCPMNIWPVYDGVFYCGYAERRTDGSD